MIASDKNDSTTRQGSQNSRTFHDAQSVFKIHPGMQKIPNHRDHVRPVLFHRSPEVLIKLSALMQIGCGQDRHLGWFGIFGGHDQDSLNLRPDSSLGFTTTGLLARKPVW